MSQLPKQTRNEIKVRYLHKHFINGFQNFFRIYSCRHLRFYTFHDEKFLNFMIEVLDFLEPRFVAKKTIIVNEAEEQNEIFFVEKGQVAVGYEINKIRKYCLLYKDHFVIGSFATVFNCTSEFIYTTIKDCSGFMIRQSNLK
jgi:hypothetical protein